MRALTSTPREGASSVAPAHRRAHRFYTPRRASSVLCDATSRCKVVILPGLGNCADDFDAFAGLLRARGHETRVLDVSRADWLRNASGALTAAYWKGELAPRPTVDWYLERCERACDAVTSESDGDVALVAHSAGGWLARVFLDHYASERRVRTIGRLVTLGSPMRAPPTDVPGVVDQTRGIGRWVDERCSSAETLRNERGIEVTCIAGTYATGGEDLFADAGAFAVGLGYKQVCGRASVPGDGITPVESALLPGARHIILDDVYHTPLGASEEGGRAWYGSERVARLWLDDVLP